MKKSHMSLTLFMLIFGLLMSCGSDENEEECMSTQMVNVTSVEATNTGMVNEKINIAVNFQVYNGCGNFSKFIETKNGNNVTIEVEAKYIGCICTQDAPIRTVNYEFSASIAGNYELHFKSSATEFITVNLTIN